MTKEIASSPVLTGLGLQVRSQRGRFYLERPLGEGDSAGVEAWGRITPLADSDDLLLEQERRKGSWSEIARGSVRKLIRTIASDTKGTFHGLGALDKALRRAGKGLERLPVKREGKTKFVYAGTRRDVLGPGGPVPLFRAAVARPRRAFGMVFVSPEADDRRGERGPEPGAGAVRGDELVGGETSAAPACMPCGTGAGEPTGSGPARAGTSPPPRRGW